jgi:hypothetical protein
MLRAAEFRKDRRSPDGRTPLPGEAASSHMRLESGNADGTVVRE